METAGINAEQEKTIAIRYIHEQIEVCNAEHERMASIYKEAESLELSVGAALRKVDIKYNAKRLKGAVSELAYSTVGIAGIELSVEENKEITLKVLREMEEACDDEENNWWEVIEALESGNPGWKDGVTMIRGPGGLISNPQQKAADYEE